MLQNFQQYNRDTVLLLGSSGNLGKIVSQDLYNKYNILRPTKEELDISNRERFSSYIHHHPCSILINFTFPSKANGDIQMYKDNKNITDNLVYHSKLFKQIIHIGSMSEYNGLGDFHKIKETARLIPPNDIYGKCKLYTYNKFSFLENVVHIRLFPCFGCSSSVDNFIKLAIDNVQNEKINNLIKKRNYRTNYLYIKDLVNILNFIIDNEIVNLTINACNNEAVSYMDIKDYIISKRSYIPPKDLKKYNIHEFTGDNSRIKSIIPELSFHSIYKYIDSLI